MLTAKHTEIKINNTYRCIAISDIHGHLDRLKILLKKVNYEAQKDYLIIVGDFIEKGNQTLETVNYLQRLQIESNRVYVILGNCEYALEEMVSNAKYAKQVVHYLNHIGKSGMIHQALDKLKIDMKTVSPAILQSKVKIFLQPYFDYFATLPTTLHLNNFVFVHAGLENRLDWQNSSISALIEMRTFIQAGHCLDDYVIVGHLPTSNQYEDSINNDIIINEKKRIISIDGGTGVKSISQLNALIIEGDGNDFKLIKESIQLLPRYQALIDVVAEHKIVNKVAWPNFEVELLKQGEFFSTCFQVGTGKTFNIKNEFLYEKKNKLYCLDDYVDQYIALKKGEFVKVIGIYGRYAYVRKDNKIGWIKSEYLKAV